MTLLESLVAVAVTLLLATIAFPAMDRAAQSLAQAQARVALMADVRTARASALREGRAVALVIGADGDRYIVDGRGVILPDSMRIASRPDRSIAFYPDGTAHGATLTLTGPKSVAHWGIAPATGLIAPLKAEQ